MTFSIMASIALPLILQASSTPAQEEAITSLDQLPIGEATSPRCAVAFAIVENWQRDGDPAGEAYPDMASANAREYFVRALATLMERHQLSREDVLKIIGSEMEYMSGQEGAEKIAAMMPACLLMKQAAGL